jgi:hypothetical protein
LTAMLAIVAWVAAIGFVSAALCRLLRRLAPTAPWSDDVVEEHAEELISAWRDLDFEEHTEELISVWRDLDCGRIEDAKFNLDRILSDVDSAWRCRA